MLASRLAAGVDEGGTRSSVALAWSASTTEVPPATFQLLYLRATGATLVTRTCTKTYFAAAPGPGSIRVPASSLASQADATLSLSLFSSMARNCVTSRQPESGIDLRTLARASGVAAAGALVGEVAAVGSLPMLS